MTLTTLTERQREIALLVGRGLSYTEIAATLTNLRSFRRSTVSPRTVLIHVQAIDRQLHGTVEGSTPYRRVMRWVLEQQKAAAA